MGGGTGGTGSGGGKGTRKSRVDASFFKSFTRITGQKAKSFDQAS